MAKKGLDTTFLHYGIRREDMSLIETNHQKPNGLFTGNGQEV